MGDFYYELGVKVVGVCAATREENGGLIALDDLLDRLDDDQVSTDDIKWAVSKLKVLGDGFRVVGDAVVSVPAELSDDSAVALDAATADGSISVNELAKRLPGGDPSEGDDGPRAVERRGLRLGRRRRREGTCRRCGWMRGQG